MNKIRDYHVLKAWATILCVGAILGAASISYASECESLLGSIAIDAAPRVAAEPDVAKFLATPLTLPNSPSVKIAVVRPGNASAFRLMLGEVPTSPQMRTVAKQIRYARSASAEVFSDSKQGPEQFLGKISAWSEDVVVLVAHNEAGNILFPNGESLSIAQAALAASKAGKLLVIESCSSACYFDTPGAAKKDVFVNESINVAKKFREMTMLSKPRIITYADVLHLYAAARAASNTTIVNRFAVLIVDMAKNAADQFPAIIAQLKTALHSIEFTRTASIALHAVEVRSSHRPALFFCHFQTIDGKDHYFALSGNQSCEEEFT